MSRDEELLETIYALYEAVPDPEAWPAALDSICSLVRAESAILFAVDHHTKCPLFGLTLGQDPSAWDDYKADYHHFDMWRQAVARLPNGSVSTGPEVVSHSTFKSSIWLNEFLSRYDIFHLLASRPDGPGQQFLSFFRSEKNEDFGPVEKQLLQRLVSHVGTALKAHFRLSDLHFGKTAVDTALDHFTAGVILIDSRGKVSEMNRSAQEIIAAKDGLVVRDGHLTTQQRSHAIALDALLARAISIAKGKDSRPLGPITVARPSNRRPYSIQVAPCPKPRTKGVLLFEHLQPAALVFVTDPNEEIELPEDGLKRIYGLTQAEARLAVRLANGKNLREISAELDIAVGTARNQLKSILHKTDTRRQAEFVRLLLSDTLLTIGTSSQRRSSD